MNYLKIFLFFIVVRLSHEIETKLPENSRPYHYEIKIFPPMNFEEKTFNGESKISLQVFKPTVNLTLHSHRLAINFESTKLTGNDKILYPQYHIFDYESQFLIFNFENEIQPGDYFLYLKFSGTIEEGSSSKNSGFFREMHMNKIIVSTHFKSVQARQTFPCWDEPAIKAIFTIWIKRLNNHIALSNMPIAETADDSNSNGYKWSIFKETPLMSTNMVCIIVTDFHHSIINKVEKLSVTTAMESSTAFHTLQRAISAKSLFEKFIDIPYDLPKLDLLAILEPNQEPMGTCGLIIVSELMDSSVDYLEDDQEVKPYVHIIYELARQWFGCLITPATPSDIWITEGLAFYMSHFILGKMVSVSSYVEFIRYRSSIYALEMDINLYDSPTFRDGTLTDYNIKAEALMHMISGLLTENVFHTAIKKMLQIYKYKTITTDEFWSTVQEAMKESKLKRNNFNLRMYMEPYILQKGYPIINVDRDHSCNTIKLTQTSSIESTEFDEQKWWVPVSIVGTYVLNFSSTFATSWMNPHDEKLITDGLSHDDWWYIVNVQSVGLYRVNYDERNWIRIVECLNSDNFRNIHILNRMKIVDDALYFIKKNKLSQIVSTGVKNYIRSRKDLVAITRTRDLLDLSNN